MQVVYLLAMVVAAVVIPVVTLFGGLLLGMRPTSSTRPRNSNSGKPYIKK